jgi:GNAT superfamily N-acetyltransferase
MAFFRLGGAVNLPRLIDACDGNAVTTLRHFVGLSGGTILEAAGAIMAASPDPYCGTYHNAAARVDNAADPSMVVDAAREYFGSLGRRFILWATDGRDKDLEAVAIRKGLTLRASGPGSPGMVRDQPVAQIRVPDGVRLKVVGDAADVAVFAHVVGEAYSVRDGLPEDGQNGFMSAARTMFANPDSLLSPHTHGKVAYLGHEPVSCAMALHSGGVAGLYWVSTVDTARRRGLGAMVATSVINECFDRGAQVVVLQASDMATATYERMGFTRVTWHRRYLGVLPPSAGEAHEDVSAYTKQAMQ